MGKPPICVDLDGSLTYTDTLFEAFVLCIKRNPLLVIMAIYWLLIRGKSFCKQQLAKRIDTDQLSLPINQPLLDWLTTKKQQGHALHLVTAADQRVADAVIKKVPIFDNAYASDGKRNLKGSHKRDFLDSTFGKGQYTYVGNSPCDLAIFKHAKHAVVINNKPGFINKAKQIADVSEVFAGAENSFKQLIKAMRPHQYAKNILLFLPLILGHYLTNLPMLLMTALGFMSFSLLASSVYMLNDLLDLASDRQHHRKRFRPFASGQLSLAVGIIGAPILLLAGLGIAIAFLPKAFLAVLGVYYALTMSYSFKLKRVLLVDVFILAILYTIRILAGMAILGAAGYSDWLLLFSFFFFTSLAFIKRYAELDKHSAQSDEVIPGRAYNGNHSSEIKIFGIASGYLSILIFALYIQSAKSLALYHLNEVLYLICPLLLYWISRAWMITTEGNMHDDPVVFALKDKVTYFVGLLIAVVAIVAML